ncbi:site-specific recombinase XerD [Mesorhizobium abyssinicae]
MSEHLLLAPLLESYFRRRLTKQRNATPATVASYRDALRMLILFAAARLRKKPAELALEELDRDLVLAFLDELEEKRNNSVTTRNARLAAIRSFFHHVAAADPASFGVAQRVLTIPIKRTHIEVTYHLTKAEVDTLIAAPRSKNVPWSARPSLSALLGTDRRPGLRSHRRQRKRPSVGAAAPTSAAARQRAQRPRRRHC